MAQRSGVQQPGSPLPKTQTTHLRSRRWSGHDGHSVTVANPSGLVLRVVPVAIILGYARTDLHIHHRSTGYARSFTRALTVASLWQPLLGRQGRKARQVSEARGNESEGLVYDGVT